MHSMPPATTISAAPAWIFWVAVITASMPEPHNGIDGEGRRVLRNISQHGCLPGGILALSGLQHIPHDDQVHFILPNLGPAQNFLDDDATQFHRRYFLQGAPEGADGGPDGAGNYHFLHLSPPSAGSLMSFWLQLLDQQGNIGILLALEILDIVFQYR